jgi:ubiquinone biosynthesis protein
MKVVLEALDTPPLVRGVFRTIVWPFQWLGYKGDANTPPVPRALTALGPAYIKFGQILSTRPDVVGDDMAIQLRVLQDKLPPFSMQEAKDEVERELGQTVEQAFTSLRKFTKLIWRILVMPLL